VSNRLIKLAATSYTPAYSGIPPRDAYCDVRFTGEFAAFGNLLPDRILIGYDRKGKPIYSSIDSGIWQNNYMWNWGLTAANNTRSGAALSYPPDRWLDPTDHTKGYIRTRLVPYTDKGGRFLGWSVGGNVQVREFQCYEKYKGVPAIPAKRSVDPQTGWNAGARSLQTIPLDGYAEFQLGTYIVGALVGFSSGTDTTSFAEASHAFYVFDGTVAVVERGVQVHTFAPVDLASRPVFRIARAGSRVTLSVAGQSYVSATPSAGVVQLDAVLYTANDYVENPYIATYQRGAGRAQLRVNGVQSRRGRGRGQLRLQGAAVAIVDGKRSGAGHTQLRLGGTAKGTVINHGRGSAALTLGGSARGVESRIHSKGPRGRIIAGNKPYSRVRSANGGYAIKASGGMPIINTGGVATVSPPIASEARLLVGNIGRVRTVGPRPRSVISEGPYARVRTSWGGYASRAYAPHYPVEGEVLIYDWRELIVLAGTSDPDLVAYAQFISTLQLATSINYLLIHVADCLDSLLLGTSVSYVADLEAVFSSELLLGSNASAAGRAGLQYAVNVLNGALSVYQGFDFHAMVTTPQGVFGVGSDGVYRLGARGDAGQTINASLLLGGNDFGSNTLKRIESLYFGLSTDGQLFARLRADGGDEQIYRVSGREQTANVRTARGVTGRTWALRLELLDATHADLQHVEFAVAASSRRVR